MGGGHSSATESVLSIYRAWVQSPVPAFKKQKQKQATDWKKVLATYKTVKRSVSRIYSNIHKTVRKSQITQQKKRSEGCTQAQTQKPK